MSLRKPYGDELVVGPLVRLPLSGCTVGIFRWKRRDSYSVRFVSDCSNKAEELLDEVLDEVLDGMLHSCYEEEYLDELREKLKETE